MSDLTTTGICIVECNVLIAHWNYKARSLRGDAGIHRSITGHTKDEEGVFLDGTPRTRENRIKIAEGYEREAKVCEDRVRELEKLLKQLKKENVK